MKVLFISRSITRPGWYRCVLPAMFMAPMQDWSAADGDPPGLHLVSSWVKQGSLEPDLLEYDVVVLQQVRGVAWARLIRRLRSRGVKVIYEIDDYVHGVGKLKDHDFRNFYTKEHLRLHELCMKTCDGAIVSTDFLATKYRRVFRDRPIWVCENGLDMARYRLSKPERGQLDGRDAVTILWAGGTGHQYAVLNWLPAVREVMRSYKHVAFASIGQDFAATLKSEFPDRVLSIPFGPLQSYPAAMMIGDVSIAPASGSDWAKAKSELRAMESAALGIPIVAAPHYKNAVVEGKTGLVADSVKEVVESLSALVESDDWRAEMSTAAKQHAVETFDMRHRVQQWDTALREVVETKTS